MKPPEPGPLHTLGRAERGERSGCLTAIYVLFGVGLLVLVVGAASVYFFLQSEEGQKLVETAERGLELVAVASSAAGTEELRNAGCEVAMVDTAESVMKVILPLLPEEDATKVRSDLEAEVGRDLASLQLVFCTAPQFVVETPDCRHLARVYGGAVEFPPEDFAVIVVQQGQDGPLCSGLYTPSGEELRTFEVE